MITSSVERWTLANGMTALYRRDAGFPLATATLLLAAGSRQESSAQAGLCSMTMDLLMQGTRRRNARAIARVMESVGASMGTQAHEDYAEMGFVVPAAELDRALGIMTEVLHEPSFPREEIAKEKSHVLASLAGRRDAIFNVAYDALNRTMYGRHPYGRPLEGKRETVKRFRRAGFQEWHAERIRPQGSILSLAGPIPSREMRRMVEKHLGRWGSHVIPAEAGIHHHQQDDSRWIPAFAGMTKKVTLRSHFEQAYLMVGFPAPSVKHPDQITLKVLNALMGGGMSSRLFVTLRENLGLAYEVSSFYPTRLNASQWVIYLGLPIEKVKTASQKLNELLSRLRDRAPGVQELDQAKAMIRGAFLMDRQSRRRQGWYQAWWEFLGRGPEYGQEFIKAIDAVTPKTAHELAKKILEKPRVTVTVVPK